MLFGLCNASTTFQCCIMTIFSYMVEKIIEVFIDDFTIFGSSFDECLKLFKLMLQRCKETNLVLNWKKCHFMVQKGIVLVHRISAKDIDVDKRNILVIEKLSPLTLVKGVRSFLSHNWFYRHFINYISKIIQVFKRINSFSIWSTIFRRILFSTCGVNIRLVDGMYLKKRFFRYLSNVIHLPMLNTLMLRRKLQKSSILGSINFQYSNIFIFLWIYVIDASTKEISLKVKRCFWIISWR